MNAIEMAVKAMLEKALTNLPPEITATIGQIGQTVAGFKAQLDRIENQNRLIIARLNIPADTEIMENNDVRIPGREI
jgi:hypothetical protein